MIYPDHLPILLLIGDVKCKVNLNRMTRYVRDMSESNLVDIFQTKNSINDMGFVR